MPVKTKTKMELGDFQTPLPLAKKVCALLRKLGVDAVSIVEPTCGTGSFLKAASEAFPQTDNILGFEVNPDYVKSARTLPDVEVKCEDFFAKDWAEVFWDLPDPILVVGNPPWVTNAALGKIAGTNLPTKANTQNMSGIDAITGKSNFDISEWMIVHLIKSLLGKNSVLAMLCKTSVARKVLKYVWESGMELPTSSLYKIDASQYFGVSVDACLLVCRMDEIDDSQECTVYSGISATHPDSTFALINGRMIADIDAFYSYGHLAGKSILRWRSGIKHDCSRVMELWHVAGERYVNSLRESVEIESNLIYPMLKSSELLHDHPKPSHYMLVPQVKTGENTALMEHLSPRAWSYLCDHGDQLDRRSSSIYRNRPRFSVFGVGPYTFAPWKVAISGFYPDIIFRCIGPFNDRTVVFDDTCYFLPCRTEEDARMLESILNSDYAQGFFRSLIFEDAKRPVTAHLLGSLDIGALATEMGLALPVWSDDEEMLPLGI